MRGHRIRTTLLGIILLLTLGVLSWPAQAQDQFILCTAAAEVDAVAARHGLKIVKRLDARDIFLVEGPAGVARQAVKDDVDGDVEVKDFEDNEKVLIPESLNGAKLNQSTASILDRINNSSPVLFYGVLVRSSYVNQPAATIIGVADAQKNYGGGVGVVAVIDTGIDPFHPALQPVLVPGFDFTRNLPGFASDWADLTQSTASILDQSTASILDKNKVTILNPSTVAFLNQSTASILDTTQIPSSFGHGTMVAGLIHLVAPTARLMPLKAFNADGTSTLFDILSAIYYAADNGANVIHMSFSMDGSSKELAKAVSYATEKRILCVASAGNSGLETLVFPAALRNVVSVASTNNKDIRSPFTNFGDALVSLAAPGEGLITTFPGNHYAAVWGTSFSAPLVSGGGSLLLGVNPTIPAVSADNLAEYFSKAKKIGQDLGDGRLDLLKALAARFND